MSHAPHEHAGLGSSEEQHTRARYWKARTLEDLGEKNDSADGFEARAREQPASWYGFLARLRLWRVDPDRAEKFALPRALASGEAPALFPLEAGPLSDDAHFVTGLELWRLGMPGFVPELLAVNRENLPEPSRRLL